MKKSELSIIAVIVIFSVLVAYAVGQSVLGKITQKGETVSTITRLSDTVAEPDKSIFYDGAKNPTVPITIGGSTNVQPLSGGQ